MRKALLIGGTSGLGWELAQLFKRQGYRVILTGRKRPRRSLTSKFKFIRLDFSPSEYSGEELNALIQENQPIDLLVYVAGFYQEGAMDKLTDFDIDKTIGVGLKGPALLLARLLRKQNCLSGLIAITSTSQWTPRQYEPVYTAVKAGLGMLANSIADDPRVGKVLVVAPAGMATKFWKGTNRDIRNMLDPKWVAKKILLSYLTGDFDYKFIKILRQPPRVEVAEWR